MYLSGESFTWPDAIALLGVLFAALFLIGIVVASIHEFRKLKISTAQRTTPVSSLFSDFERTVSSTRIESPG